MFGCTPGDPLTREGGGEGGKGDALRCVVRVAVGDESQRSVSVHTRHVPPGSPVGAVSTKGPGTHRPQGIGVTDVQNRPGSGISSYRS